MQHADRISRGAFLKSLGALVVAPMLPAARARPGTPKPFDHPEPREGITAEHVLPDAKLPDRKRVRGVYAFARQYPVLFDGVFCACRCRDSMGHRSLLACYESDQATGCNGCIEEGELVGKLAGQGKALADIRRAIDSAWG
ncbi:MAG: hypothetical protein JWO05_2481 [Gemmatimonadetes bacterium]|nr:hypothetical protein [Gemmatimonadota bacterium]